MSQIQQVFAELDGLKKQIRDLKKIYRDALKNSHEYQDLVKELTDKRTAKKEIELKIQSEFNSEQDQIDNLTLEVKEKQEKIDSMVLAAITRGEVVKVHDKYNNVYDTFLTVKFKKSDEAE